MRGPRPSTSGTRRPGAWETASLGPRPRQHLPPSLADSGRHSRRVRVPGWVTHDSAPRPQGRAEALCPGDACGRGGLVTGTRLPGEVMRGGQAGGSAHPAPSWVQNQVKAELPEPAKLRCASRGPRSPATSLPALGAFRGRRRACLRTPSSFPASCTAPCPSPPLCGPPGTFFHLDSHEETAQAAARMCL